MRHAAVAGLLALSLALAPRAGAQDVGPCRQDADRLCPGAEMRGGRLPACLREKSWSLSPPCSEYLPELERAYWDKREGKDAAPADTAGE